MMKYPLLVKGVRLPSVAAGATSTASGTFVTGRGKCIKLDLINPSIIALNETFNSLVVGGQTVLDAVPAGLFKYYAVPVQRVQLIGEFGENQTFQILTANGSVAALQSNFLQYYENPFDNGRAVQLLNDNTLNTKQMFFSNLAAGGVDRTETFIVPKNRGNIFAIKPFAEMAFPGAPADLENAFMTISINGVEIIEEVSVLTFIAECTRQNFFPINIEPGSTLRFRLNNDSAATIFASVGLFFCPANRC